MPKFLMTELVGVTTFTARVSGAVGDDPTVASAALVESTEKGKFVKLAAESRFVLAAAADKIETVIDSINAATQDGWSIGGLRQCDGSGAFLNVTFGGSQAAGTGTIAVGTYVLVGAVVAKGTALAGPPRVVSATTQATAAAAPFAWRVVSLGAAGTGAVGTTGVIQRVG